MNDVCPCTDCPWEDSCETCEPTTCDLFYNEQESDDEVET